MGYLIHIAILVAIYSILGLSLNLIVGYTGLFSMTHAVFYGIGAYSTALLLTVTGMDFFLSVSIGVMLALVISIVSGIVLSRFSDDYYAIVSLGFGVIMYAVFLNWQGLTRGPFGIPGIGRPSVMSFVFSSGKSFLILSLIALGIVFLVSRFIVKSSFGRVLKAIREDEKAIRVFGYNTTFYKLAIFVMVAMMAAVAGSLYASYLTFIGPSIFMLRESIFMLAIIILGGLGSLGGPVVGALFLILLPEALRFVGLPSGIAAQMRQVIYGVILVVLMLYRPQGLIGKYRM